jgi:steroid delta-isomerase-like uncharacterized protein
MSDANKAIAKRFFDEMCNGRKLNLAQEFFAADHTHHDPSNPGLGPGPEGMKQLVTVYQTAFADAHWTVNEMLSAGDTVITRWTGTGTHSGSLQGIPPTGKKVKVTGIWMQRFSGGKIVESWDNWDSLGLLQQVGAIPALGQGQAAR